MHCYDEASSEYKCKQYLCAFMMRTLDMHTHMYVLLKRRISVSKELCLFYLCIFMFRVRFLISILMWKQTRSSRTCWSFGLMLLRLLLAHGIPSIGLRMCAPTLALSRGGCEIEPWIGKQAHKHTHTKHTHVHTHPHTHAYIHSFLCKENPITPMIVYKCLCELDACSQAHAKIVRALVFK